MKTLLALCFFTLSLFCIQAYGGENYKEACFQQERLRYTAADASAVLCGSVGSINEIENVTSCYFDSRLQYTAPLNSALLCSDVKSERETEKVIQCYIASDRGWSSLLNCK